LPPKTGSFALQIERVDP